jgi:serine/threonine-protein kinase
MSVAEALRLAREAARGLDHAHRRGIVHRDVKPANLLLAADGRLEISDFGIAKMAGQATELTVTGSVVGSPHYLSPEQVRGEELDGRSDLFSLGVVLYEMLGGRRPFDGDTFTTLLYKILHADPEPIRLQPGLQPDLAGLLGGLLAKDPDHRPPDGATVAEQLAALERDLPPEVLAGPAVLPAEAVQEGSVGEAEVLPGTRPAPVLPPPPPPPAGAGRSSGQPAAASRSASASGAPALGAGGDGSTKRRIWVAAVIGLALLAAGAMAGVAGFRLLRGHLGESPDRQAGAADLPVSEPAPRPEPEPEPTSDGPRDVETAERPEAASQPPAQIPAQTPDRAPSQAAQGSSPRSASAVPPPVGRPAAERSDPDSTSDPGAPLSPRTRRLDGAGRPRPELREAAAELALPVDQQLRTGLGLTFDVRPPGAFVLVDGTVIGRAGELDPSAGGSAYTLPGPGTYRIKLRSPGMKDHRVLVEASESGPPRSRVSARLEPAPAGELAIGDLKLYRVQEAVGFEILPPLARPRARVLVDGEPAGRAARFPGRILRSGTWLRLDPGRHRVSVVAPGFGRRDVAVEVSDGAAERRQRIQVRLVPER